MLNSCANRRSFFLTYLSNPNYNYRSLRRIPWYYHNTTDDALLHQSCPQTFRFQRARKLQRIVILKEPQCWVRFEVTKIKHSKIQCWAQVLSLGLFKFANFLRPNLCFQFHLNKILFEKKTDFMITKYGQLIKSWDSSTSVWLVVSRIRESLRSCTKKAMFVTKPTKLSHNLVSRLPIEMD